MAENTKIQWTDHTVNFWTGCIKVSPGCKYCYMYRDQERYGKNPTDVLQVKQKTIDRILRKAEPGDKIFTCSWSDFFIKEADLWRDWAWGIIRSRPDLQWQILTKRPERIADCLPPDWGEGWPNVWLGVSVETQKEADNRIHQLIKVDCKVRFLSIEPILGRVDLGGYLVVPDMVLKNPIHWVIIGGESGNENGKYKYRPSQLGWYKDIVKVCTESNVPVFVKQLGTFIAKKDCLADRNGGNIEEFPPSLQVREFPKT